MHPFCQRVLRDIETFSKNSQDYRVHKSCWFCLGDVKYMRYDQSEGAYLFARIKVKILREVDDILV